MIQRKGHLQSIDALMSLGKHCPGFIHKDVQMGILLTELRCQGSHLRHGGQVGLQKRNVVGMSDLRRPSDV
jgi:hypothetical protein